MGNLFNKRHLVEFKKLADCVAQRLKEQPVIVAHSENIFDGSGIKRLLSNKFELDKVCPVQNMLLCHILECSIIMEKLTELHLKIQTRTAALEIVPKDRNGKLSKDYLRVALDAVAASALLPRIGAVAQVYFINLCYRHSNNNIRRQCCLYYTS